MKRHLIWIIAGTAAIGIAVPAFAAVQPSATPDDNGTPGEVRGNCDEAEHVADPAVPDRDRRGPLGIDDADDDRDHRPERVRGPTTTTAGTRPEHHDRQHRP